MLYKKSQGHVEMVISFLIFIGAVFFIFAYISPIKKQENFQNKIDELKDKIMNKIVIKIGILSVIVKNNPSGASNPNPIVSQKCYNFEPSEYITDLGEGNDVKYFEVLDRDFNNRYLIYFSKKIERNYAPNKNSNCDSNTFYLSSFLKEDIVSKELIMDLKSFYERNYEQLKKTLGIDKDFSFVVKDLNGEEIPDLSVENKKGKGMEVRSIDIPMRIIDSEAKINNYIFSLRFS